MIDLFVNFIFFTFLSTIIFSFIVMLSMQLPIVENIWKNVIVGANKYGND